MTTKCQGAQNNLCLFITSAVFTNLCFGLSEELYATAKVTVFPVRHGDTRILHFLVILEEVFSIQSTISKEKLLCSFHKFHFVSFFFDNVKYSLVHQLLVVLKILLLFLNENIILWIAYFSNTPGFIKHVHRSTNHQQ